MWVGSGRKAVILRVARHDGLAKVHPQVAGHQRVRKGCEVAAQNASSIVNRVVGLARGRIETKVDLAPKVRGDLKLGL